MAQLALRQELDPKGIPDGTKKSQRSHGGVQVSCGHSHVLARTQMQQCVSWGSGAQSTGHWGPGRVLDLHGYGSLGKNTISVCSMLHNSFLEDTA